MTKQATVELLQKQLPGYYSVEQVINIINGIEDSGDGSFDEDRQQKLKDAIVEKVENYINRLNASDIADFDSAEFELNGNEISVYDISVNTDSIIEEVDEAIDDVFDNFFAPKALQTV